MKIIIDREKIILSEIQKKMIRSGWGNDSVDKVIVEKMTYFSDGLKVKGYLAYPADSSKRYPCIIWCRGGIGNAGSIDEFNAQGIFGQLAGWGFAVFQTQYRGNAGSEGRDEFGGEDLNDVLNLIPLANELEFTDTNIWGIEGWSRGGMMTYLALTKTDKFKAAIVTGGIANLRCNAEESVFMKKLYEHSLGKFKENEFYAKCSSRSIINFPEKISKATPILMMHGTHDNRVLPHDSLDLSYKLLEHKIPFRLVLLENGDHFLKSHRQEVDRLRENWFKNYLK